MRLRMAYTKMEDARYIAHLDLMRVFERAIRRGGIAMAYTEGFNPRPKISFGFALAVGTEGEEEYVDIEIRCTLDTDEVLGRIQEQLPPGIRLLQGEALVPGAKALMAILNEASYRIFVPLAMPIEPERLREAVRHWLARERVDYSRSTKKGLAEKDIRPWIENLTGEILGDEAVFGLEIKMGNSGSVRPEEVLASLRELENLPLDIEEMHITRTAVYVRSQERKRSPFEQAAVL